MNRIGELPFEVELRTRLRTLSPSQRKRLLAFWSQPVKNRGNLIVSLYRAEHEEAADLLLDVELDAVMRLTLKEQLLLLERETREESLGDCLG